jgi:hypothetical protein
LNNKILDVDFEKQLVFDVGVQSRNVTALSIVIEILGKIDPFGEEFDHPASPAFAALVGDEDKLTSGSVLIFVILYHCPMRLCSWRPCSQFQ